MLDFFAIAILLSATPSTVEFRFALVRELPEGAEPIMEVAFKDGEHVYALYRRHDGRSELFSPLMEDDPFSLGRSRTVLSLPVGEYVVAVGSGDALNLVQPFTVSGSHQVEVYCTATGVPECSVSLLSDFMK